MKKIKPEKKDKTEKAKKRPAAKKVLDDKPKTKKPKNLKKEKESRRSDDEGKPEANVETTTPTLPPTRVIGAVPTAIVVDVSNQKPNLAKTTYNLGGKYVSNYNLLKICL